MSRGLARVGLAAGIGLAVLCGAVAPATAAPSPAARTIAHHPRNPVIPVKRFFPALHKFRGYVGHELGTLRSQVRVIGTDAALDNTAAAKAAWLTAHQTWLRIGEDNGQYGAFGRLGQKIDGMASGLTGGVNDSRFTGFHKIELDLWTYHDNLLAVTDTSQLSDLLRTLASKPLTHYFHPGPDGVENWILRSHEVIEDALRDSLSADDDYGSGTDAASVVADAAAARKIVGLLAPIIHARAPHLARHALRQLAAVRRAAMHTRRSGQWVAVSAMKRVSRERLDAAVGAADEVLAPIPDLLHLANT